MGTDAVTRELVPRYLTEAAITRDASGLSRASAVIFELVHQIGAKKVASNDPGLIEATLALESCKPIKKPWTKLLAALDASAVAKVRAGSGGPAPTAPAPPAPKVKKKAASSKAASSKAASSKAASSKAASSKAASSRAASSKAASASATAGGVAGGGHLARYEAGEHRAVWAELRALGDKVQEAPLDAEARAIAAATMKAFVASVDVIAAVLKKAKYTLAEKKAVRPPRRDVAKQLGALAKIVGPLPIALVAFYEACDGVTLAQDVDAPVDDSPLFGPGVLDELGRNDPLIVAPLSVVLEDAKEQQARASGPVRLYVAPDPACKGTIDDEIPDENPVRTHATPAMDAELVGGSDGWSSSGCGATSRGGGFLGSAGRRRPNRAGRQAAGVLRRMWHRRPQDRLWSRQIGLTPRKHASSWRRCSRRLCRRRSSGRRTKRLPIKRCAWIGRSAPGRRSPAALAINRRAPLWLRWPRIRGQRRLLWTPRGQA
ncbi:MAG: hypothetical protein H6724_09590 [Sandaracinus sp.]|nr:hypothetical protein [Sandaracinus sp.]